MAAEYECCVCHHPIVDAIAPPLGSAERMCRVCSFLDGMGFDQAAQERIREFVGQPTMPFGYGRARIEQRHADALGADIDPDLQRAFQYHIGGVARIALMEQNLTGPQSAAAAQGQHFLGEFSAQQGEQTAAADGGGGARQGRIDDLGQ